MSREEFIQMIREQVKEYLPEEMQKAELLTGKLQIGNQERLAFSILVPEKNMLPALDLEEYYQMVMRGETISKVIKELAEDYAEILSGKSLRVQELDIQEIPERLHMLAVNLKERRNMLKKIPHICMYDLAIIPAMITPDGRSLPIDRGMAGILGLSDEELLRKAMNSHMKNLPPVFTTMGGREDQELKVYNLDDNECVSDHELIYLLTNPYGACGTAVIANPEILEKIGKKLGQNYYVLPCTTHELVIYPERIGMSPRQLQEAMHRYATERQIDATILTDQVFAYNVKTKELSLCCDSKQTEQLPKKKDDVVR